MKNADLARILDRIADALMFVEKISEQPCCNTCWKSSCEYRPDWGEPTRINCPLWKGEDTK